MNPAIPALANELDVSDFTAAKILQLRNSDNWTLEAEANIIAIDAERFEYNAANLPRIPNPDPIMPDPANNNTPPKRAA